MVPSDYRLDYVTARLIERLEGARPSYAGQPEAAMEAFTRVATQHVEAAIAEYQELALQDPAPQAAILRQEVLQTFLPRYHRVAVAFNQAEEGGFGFGPLAQPAGRLALGAASLFALVWLMRLSHLPLVWPLILLDLSLVFWPDIAAWLQRRHHLQNLHAIVHDMGRIQDQSLAYQAPAGSLPGPRDPQG